MRLLQLKYKNVEDEYDQYEVKFDIPDVRLKKYNERLGEAQKMLMNQRKENIIDESVLDKNFTFIKEEINIKD